ncbi:MAG TPA: RDD family protein [Thermosynechococcaceae cyanobacterium]
MLQPAMLDADSRRFPRVPLERRGAAFAVDFGAAALLSLLFGGLYIPAFVFAWLGLRVVLVSKNRGQSLGRWLFDMKAIDPKYRSIPNLTELSKREAITGAGALLMLIGLANLSAANAWILLTPIPLLVDCSFTFTDEEFRQAYHDRLARTVIAQTRRGYSLDIKVKKLFAQSRQRVR